jgi:hypothetical protein
LLALGLIFNQNVAPPLNDTLKFKKKEINGIFLAADIKSVY